MRKLFLALALFLLLTQSAYAGWYNSAWQYRKEIIVDAANVDADLTNFPLYVKINNDADLAAAQADGDDIRFTSSDGTTLLKYEEESWSGGGGSNATANYWVKVPKIEADDGAIIYVYYGNADATDAQDAANVWDSNYKGVWHLKETVTDEATGATHYDSTANANNGTQYYNDDATGQIYNGQSFDGAGDYIARSYDSDFTPGISSWTVEATVKASSGATERTIVDWYRCGANSGCDAPDSAVYTLSINSNNKASWYVRDDNGNSVTLTSTASVADNSWHFLTGTFNPTADLRNLYVDGVEVNNSAVALTSLSAGSVAIPLEIGRTFITGWGSPTNYFNGLIDETRISNTARSADWIKFEYYNMNESDQELSWGAEEQWLAGWDKRIKVTIDQNDIDSALSDFPILVYLSASSGRNSKDVSRVFDEIGANNKKIAVTKSDGTTQCYVEIEKWDNSAEQAWLWVKVSGTNSVAAGADTDLYLYYDNDHADNTTYVGDNGSIVAQNVWDSNFKAVWHLKETVTDESTGATHYDSTANANNGTQYYNDDATGKIYNGQSFDGTGDYVRITNAINGLGIHNSSQLTISAWVYPNIINNSTNRYIIDSWAGIRFHLTRTWETATRGYIQTYNYSEASVRFGTLNPNNWYHLVYTYNASTPIMRAYVNGVQVGTESSVSGNIKHENSNLDMGPSYNGLIDEVRISNTARSAAWLKASYESERDNLLDFGLEEVSGAVTGGFQLQGLKMEGVKVE